MNTQAFRQIIREEVEKALRASFKQILAEHAAASLMNQPMITEQQFTSDSVSPEIRQNLRKKMESTFGYTATPQQKSELKPPAKGDFSAFFADTAANMTPQDIAGLKNLG